MLWGVIERPRAARKMWLNCWQAWPTAYQDPDDDAVRAFEDSHRSEIRYHMYLQWQAHEQLAWACRTLGQRMILAWMQENELAPKAVDRMLNELLEDR